MTLLPLALQALLAPLLGYLGGILVRHASSATSWSPDRPLGISLWLGSIFAAALGAARIIALDTSPDAPSAPTIAGLAALAIAWVAALVLGLRARRNRARFRAASLAAAAASALLFVFSDTRVEWAEAVLLSGLMVCLGAKLLFATRPHR